MTKLKSKMTKMEIQMDIERLCVVSLIEAKFNGRAGVVLLARREDHRTTFGTDADIESRVLGDYPLKIKTAIFHIVGLNCPNENCTKVKDTPYFKIIISKSAEKLWFDFEFTIKTKDKHILEFMKWQMELFIQLKAKKITHAEGMKMMKEKYPEFTPDDSEDESD